MRTTLDAELVQVIPLFSFVRADDRAMLQGGVEAS
jgi:hypothetical protein